MNINKLLQYGFYLLFLANMVAFLLAIFTMYHLPAMSVWVVLAIAAAVVCAAVLGENTTD